MALPGPKPKPDGQRRNTSAPVHEYRNFPDVPNPNPRKLPAPTELYAATGVKKWPLATLRWWVAVSRLPHTVAWTDSDWAFAHEAAFIHARFHAGGMDKTMAELRRRNHELGATWAGRLDLRIRYRDDAGAEVRQDKDPAVTAMADYRKAVQ